MIFFEAFNPNIAPACFLLCPVLFRSFCPSSSSLRHWSALALFFVKVSMWWITFRWGMGFAGVCDSSPPLAPFFVSWEFLLLFIFNNFCFCSRCTTPYGKAKADVTWLVLLFCLSRCRISMDFVFSRSCFFVLFLSFLGLVLVNRCQIAMEELGARIVFLSSHFVFVSVHLPTFRFWESFAVFLAFCIALLAK